MIKLLLADDHQMFIDGIKSFLEKYEDIAIVAEANNGYQVLEILETEPIDIVVLDINMPGMDGIETTKIIRKKYANTKVLILSMYDNKNFIIKLIRNGAAGYILKNKTKEELYTAIQNVAAGRTHYGLEIMNHAIAVSQSKEEEEVQLTEREVEVMIKVAEGFSSKDAAKKLHISETTVNTHRRNIMSKLNLNSATQLVRYAIKKGYVEL